MKSAFSNKSTLSDSSPDGAGIDYCTAQQNCAAGLLPLSVATLISLSSSAVDAYNLTVSDTTTEAAGSVAIVVKVPFGTLLNLSVMSDLHFSLIDVTRH